MVPLAWFCGLAPSHMSLNRNCPTDFAGRHQEVNRDVESRREPFKDLRLNLASTGLLGKLFLCPAIGAACCRDHQSEIAHPDSWSFLLAAAALSITGAEGFGLTGTGVMQPRSQAGKPGQHPHVSDLLVTSLMWQYVDGRSKVASNPQQLASCRTAKEPAPCNWNATRRTCRSSSTTAARSPPASSSTATCSPPAASSPPSSACPSRPPPRSPPACRPSALSHPAPDQAPPSPPPACGKPSPRRPRPPWPPSSAPDHLTRSSAAARPA